MGTIERHLIAEGSRFVDRLDSLYEEVEKLEKLIPIASDGKWEYSGGYIGSRYHFYIRCTYCGSIREVSGENIRKWKRGEPITYNCNGCDKFEREINRTTCPVCGKYVYGGKKYCSHECCYIASQDRQKRIRRERFVSKHIICKNCGNTFMSEFKNRSAFCCDECKKEYLQMQKHYRYKKRLAGKVDDNDITLRKLIKRDMCKCAICGELIDEQDYTLTDDGYFIVGEKYPSIDHIIPLAKGGRHSWSNVQLAHHRCNTLKSDSLTYSPRQKSI